MAKIKDVDAQKGNLKKLINSGSSFHGLRNGIGAGKKKR